MSINIPVRVTGEKQLKDVERGVGRISKATSGLTKAMGSLGIAFSGAVVLGGLKKTIAAASDTTESMNKVKEVFEDSAKEVIKFSETAAESLGTSKQSALEMTGTIGNLLTAMKLGEDKAAKMSTSIVQLAADLGSFNNVGTEEALIAIRAALVGEAEPIRRFGADVRQARLDQLAMAEGVEFTKGKMDAQTKALMAMKAIMLDTKKAQGDFARTSGDLANATKTMTANIGDMAARLGENLIPGITAFVNGVNDLIGTSIVEHLQNEQIEFNALVDMLKDANLEQDTRNRAIKTLQKEYPDYIENINLETAGAKKLAEMQNKVNESILKRIQIESAREKIKEFTDKITNSYEKLFEVQLELQESYGLTAEEAAKATTNENNLTAGIDGHSIKMGELSDKIFTYRESIKKTQEEQKRFMEGMKELGVDVGIELFDTNNIKNAGASITDVVNNFKQLIPTSEAIGQIRLSFNLPTEQKITLELQKQIKLSRPYENFTERAALNSNTTFKILTGVSQTLIQAAMHGNDLADALERAARALVTKGLMGLVGGVIGSTLIPGVGFGAGFKFASGFQHGGSFTVPGSGSGDRPYVVNLEPGERVDVTPRNQTKNFNGGINVTINTNMLDENFVRYQFAPMMKRMIRDDGVAFA